MEFLKITVVILLFSLPIWVVFAYVFWSQNKKKHTSWTNINKIFNWKFIAVLISCLCFVTWINKRNNNTTEKIIAASSCTVWNNDGTDSLIRLFYTTNKQNEFVFQLSNQEVQYLKKQPKINIISYCKTHKTACTEKDFEVYAPYIKSKQAYTMTKDYNINQSGYENKMKPSQDYHYSYKPTINSYRIKIK